MKDLSLSKTAFGIPNAILFKGRFCNRFPHTKIPKKCVVPRRKKLHAFLPGVCGRLLFFLPGRPDDFDPLAVSRRYHVVARTSWVPKLSSPVLTHSFPTLPTRAFRAVPESSVTPEKNARKDLFLAGRLSFTLSFGLHRASFCLSGPMKILRKHLAVPKLLSFCTAPSVTWLLVWRYEKDSGKILSHDTRNIMFPRALFFPGRAPTPVPVISFLPPLY